MTISIETLRKLSAVNPFVSGSTPISPGRAYLGRLDEAGLLPYLARANFDMGYQEAPDFEKWYFRSRDGKGYLLADMIGRADGSKITQAVIQRVAHDDPELARSYKEIQEAQGGERVFQQMDSAVRKYDLEQVARPKGLDLEEPEDLAARRGRAM